MNFIEMPQQAIEPHLSSMGYRFVREIKLGGEKFICEYVNPEENKKVQLVFKLYAHNAFCKEIYEEELE